MQAPSAHTPSSPRLLHASLGPDAPSIVAALTSDEYITNSPVLGKHARRLSCRRSASSGSSVPNSPALLDGGKTLLDLKPFPSTSDLGLDKTVTEGEAGGSRTFAAATGDMNGVRSARLDINNTDIALEDADEDSPVFRAAIAGLEKRTASVKKACKTVLKAWQDVRAQLMAARAPENQLAEALEEMIALTLNTLGPLDNVLLGPAREKEAKRAKERLEMLDRYVEGPVQRLLDLCRGTQEQLKLFEAESKLYYASMQKWMSTRSNNPTNVLSSAGMTPSTTHQSIESSSSNKTDLSAEKQQLRRLAFARARLEIFAVMSRLHGGQAELELFNDIMKFAAWCAESPNRFWGSNWPSESAKTILASLHAGSKQASLLASASEEQVAARLAYVDSRIENLELITKAAQGDAVSASDGSKAPTHRIKSLLNSLGISGSSQSQQSESSPQIASDAQSINSNATSKALSKVRRKVSTKISRGGSSSSVVPSPAMSHVASSPVTQVFPRWRAREEVQSPTAAAPAATSQGIAALGPRSASQTTPLKSPAGNQLRLSGEHGRTSEDFTERFAGITMASSPTMSRRAISMSGQRPALPELDARQLSAARRRTSTEDGTAFSRPPSFGLGISTGDMTLMNVPEAIPKYTTNRPSSAGKERKKQGVLWVSKPISGSGGADAPRGVKLGLFWHEAWCVLSGSGHLGEYADWKDAKILQPSAPIIDLRFATVREARGLDRRFAFEIVTRDSRRFFQAADEISYKEWTTAISRAIESLIDGTSSVRQVDKVAKSSQRWASSIDAPTLFESDEFGSNRVGSPLGGIASSRAFSQSLTDLTSSSSAKLLNWGSDAAANLRTKRDSRPLTMVDESDVLGRYMSPNSQERGISNKTPLSGYVGNSRQMSKDPSDSGVSIASDLDVDFDKRIEEMVHSHYGGTPDPKRQSAPPGVYARRMSATRSKETRAAEIARISRQPENSICADCRTRGEQNSRAVKS